MTLKPPSSKPLTKHRVTMVDVAKAANIPLSAVSAALHDTGKVGEKRKKIVQKIAKEMGYQVHPAARFMRAHQSGIVGIVTEVFDVADYALDRFQETVLQYFVQRCEEMDRSYHVAICRHIEPHEADAQTDTSKFKQRMLGGSMIDGVIVAGYIHEPLRSALDLQGIPRVSLVEDDQYCVRLRSESGFQAAMHKLYVLGHRRIAFIGGAQQHFVARSIRETFKQTLQMLGLSVPAHWVMMSEIHGYHERNEGYARILSAVNQLLREPNHPTAFVCYGNDLARTVMYAAMENGLRVPKDISITGNGPRSSAEEGAPKLTIIESDFAGLVREGLNMLDTLLQNRKPEHTQVEVGSKLLEGQTIGPASA